MADIEALLQRYSKLKNELDMWVPTYEILSQYILMRKQNFRHDKGPGPFMFNFTYDGTAVNAARVMAASMFGQVWPNPFESFQFTPEVAQSGGFYEDDTLEFFQDVNDVTATQLARPEAGFMTALQEAILDLIIYGTAFIQVIATGDVRQPLRFRALDARSIVIDEDEAGFIDTAYILDRLTVRSVVAKYKYKNVSQDVQTKWDNQKFDEEIQVLQIIEPRLERNPFRFGVLDMPFASVHVELNKKHELKESGFMEMPVVGARYTKNPGEKYGRSPGMDAIPDIRELNKAVETYTKAGGMALNPPRMISTEHVIGGYPVWKEGAWIPIHATGRIGSDRPPIEPAITIGNPGWARERIVDLREQVQSHFMLDRLTDLNNRSRQTLGEADIRNDLRQHITGPVLSRVLTELVGPALDRSFNILLEHGFYGVVKGSQQDFELQVAGIQPKYISESFIQSRMSGIKGYRQNFICPAARSMRREELLGMQNFREYLVAMAPVRPEIMHLIDFDEWTRREHFLSGVSLKTLNSDEQIQETRQAAGEAQAQAQQSAQLMQGSEVLKNAGAGIKSLGDVNASAA